MPKKCLFLILLILVITAQFSFADNVTFKSKQEGLELTGILTKPQGDGPFPAVVLLHGCGGFEDSKPRTESWSKRLVSWGYATLQLDSFGPRNVSSVCTEATQAEIMFYYHAQDAYDAKSFLAELPFIEPNRIALIGWSHGGVAALSALARQIDPKNSEIPFKAAVAFYPLCDLYLYNFNAPLLILIGESDDWHSAYQCSAMMPKEKSDAEVVLKIYPGAYHAFDWEGMDEIYEGHRLLYDPIAVSDAIGQVKQFLANYLN